MKILLAPALALAGLASSPAAITYVDAAAGNLTLADGSAFVPGVTANVYNDNNWALRSAASLASGGTVYEAGGATNGALTGEDVPTLRQTVTGLTAGSYDVYAYFWVASNERWGLSAGLTDSSLISVNGTGTVQGGPLIFSTGGATVVTAASLSDGTFATAPTQAIGGGDRTLAQLYVGTATVDNTGTLSVFIDNQITANAGNSPSATNSRSWFDGIGYQAVPEPSALLLGLLGGGALLRRKRF